MTRFLVYTAIAVGVFMTAMGMFAPFISRAEMINHFRPYTLTGTSVLLAFALAARMSGAIWYSAALTALNVMFLLLPLLWSANTAQQPALTTPRDIKVVTFNLGGAEVEEVADYPLHENADIVVLQEAPEAYAAQLDTPLKKKYPHSHACKESQDCMLAIFSKRPLRSVLHSNRAKGSPQMIWARIEDAEFGSFQVADLHMA